MSRNPASILYDINGNPVATFDGYNINLTSSGFLVMGKDKGDKTGLLRLGDDGSLLIEENEEKTFMLNVIDVVIENNKSMVSILNGADSGVKLKVHAVYIKNVQTTAIIGVISTFELLRMTGHTNGTNITNLNVLAFETTDILNSAISVRTGATILGESSISINRWKWSSDDWTIGNATMEGLNHGLQNFLPSMAKYPKLKPITLLEGEGITLKHSTNSENGVFDINVIFSQV